jgi:hypothetical protein
MNHENQIDVAIITPLLKERDAVLRHLRVADELKTKNRIYHKSVIPIDNREESYSVVVLSLSGMGNVEAAIATSQAITVWNPSQIHHQFTGPTVDNRNTKLCLAHPRKPRWSPLKTGQTERGPNGKRGSREAGAFVREVPPDSTGSPPVAN